MSAEDRNEGNDEERRELRKLAYEDSDRTFAEVDPDRLTPKLPFDPPKLQWKDLVGDPEPKPSKDGVLDPKPSWFDPKQPWMDPKAPWIDPKVPWIDPKQPWFDPKQPWTDPKQPWLDPKPIDDPDPKGILDPKSVVQDPKNVLDPKPIKDPKGILDPKGVLDPKSVIRDPKLPKGDVDPDPKGIFDPKNIYDPPKLAYDPWQFDPGRVFDPGRFGFDPGAVARRPFVLGMPHHAPGAGAMAGADPRAGMVQPPTSYGTDVSPAEGGAADSAAAVEAMLARVESSMRVLRADLERLDDYYRELRERYDELGAAEDGTDDADTTEDDSE